MKLIDLLRLLTVIVTICCEAEGDVKLVVIAGSDVVLPCSPGTKQDIEWALFVWKKDGRQDVFLYIAGNHYNNGHLGQDEQFKGRVFHFPNELKKGNASIVIKRTRLSDSGTYICNFPFIQQQTFHVDLLVGTTAKPQVKIFNIAEDRALLQCEVRGAFPKPHIEWTDSDGNVLHAEEQLEDSDDLDYPPTLTLQTSVTQTGSFCCVVTQQELNHVTEVHIHVDIPSDIIKKIWIAAIVGAVVGASIVLLATVLILCWKHRRRAMEKRHNGDNIPMVPRPSLDIDESKNVALHSSYPPGMYYTKNVAICSSCHSAIYKFEDESSLPLGFNKHFIKRPHWPEKLQKRREHTEPDEPDEAVKLHLHQPPKMHSSPDL